MRFISTCLKAGTLWHYLVKGDPNHTKEELWNTGMSSYITIIEG